MRTLLFSIALLLSAAPVAHAGGYLSVGIGADALLGGELNSNFDTDTLTVGRVALGGRLGPVALEGVMFGADLRGTSSQILGQTTGGDEFSSTSLGLELKYFQGLGAGLEAYGKVGINRTWLTAGQGVDTDLDYQGQGYALGVGVQYGFKLLPSVGAAVWLDYNRHLVKLNDEGQPTLEGSTNMITLGVTIGG